MAEQLNTDFLPDASGRDLGSASQRWDAFIQNLDVSGTVTLTGNVTTTGDITADQFISTVATGSAPFAATSTTKCTNLNADLLDGADWAAPAALGSTTPAAVSATTLSTTSTSTLAGSLQFTNATTRRIEFSASSASQIGLAIDGCNSTGADGGPIDIIAGDTSSSGNVGGNATFAGGNGSGAGQGGQALFRGGAGGATGNGGVSSFTGGDGGATSGVGGSVNISGGSASGGNSAGGAIVISAGLGNGTGANGAITISHATSESCAAGGVADSDTTAVTVNANVTTDQNLMAFTVPAKTLNRAGRLCRVRGYGLYSTQAGQTPTLTIKVKLGAVTLVSWTSAATTASQTDKPWNFDCDLVTATTGATGTIEAHGHSRIQIGSGSNGADTTTHSDAITAASSAIDLTSSNSLQITATFSTNTSPSNAATQRLMTVEVY